jgi:hypothetical protein
MRIEPHQTYTFQVFDEHDRVAGSVKDSDGIWECFDPQGNVIPTNPIRGLVQAAGVVLRDYAQQSRVPPHWRRRRGCTF